LFTVALVVLALMVPAVASAEVPWPTCNGETYVVGQADHKVYPAAEGQEFNIFGQAVVDLSDATEGMTVFFSELNAQYYPWGGALIIGSDFDDVICGSYWGADEIRAGAGDDMIFGGFGYNAWTPELEPDVAADEYHFFDELYGNTGADTIHTGFSPLDNLPIVVIPSFDALPPIPAWYGDGPQVYGGFGADTLIGSSFNHGPADGDDSHWYFGDDLMSGGRDDDYIDGGEGDDLIKGGDGADTIYTGFGFNKVVGGGGDDVIRGFMSSKMPTTCVAADPVAPGYFDPGAGDIFKYGYEYPNELFGGPGDDDIFTGRMGDRAYGATGDDYLEGWCATDYLFGGAGNDTVEGWQSADELYGGGGADTLYADGSGLLDGPADGDQLWGQGGADALWGDSMEDTLKGGNQDDTLNGGKGADTMYGEKGDDTLNGGDGVDYMEGNLGDDTLNAGDGDDQEVYGGLGNDTINGDDGVDFLYGEAGNDTLRGGDDGDVLVGGTGADFLFGDKGNDWLFSNDWLTGPDASSADLAVDDMTGGAGDDNFYSVCSESDIAREAAEAGSADFTWFVSILDGEFEVGGEICPA
jgi:Ca2+-binding RTX toxin-like protein